MCPKGIRHQFPDQTEEKKEEGLRGWWVGVSLGFLIICFRRTQYITSIGLFYKNGGSCSLGYIWEISEDTFPTKMW